MTEIDLEATIEAAAEPIWWESNPDCPIDRESEAWDECKALARRALKAALPLVEERVRERASDELRAWADQIVDPGISGPRAIRRRTLMAAASKILPKLSPAESAEKIASGEAYVIHCTALDIEDDQQLLSVEGKDTKPMITDEQVAEEIARLTRERDRAEQLAQHRGELLEKFTGELAAANAELALVREVLSCAKEWWSNRYLDGDALRSDERELGAALDMLAAAKSGGDVPVESAPAAETPSCDEPVWDGPYQMRCGRLMPRGECGRHGKPLGGAASVATTEGVDHG